MSKIRNSRLQSKRFSLVEQWLECDLTKKDFCRQNQINVHTFSYWLNKYNKRTGTGSDFTELKPQARPDAPDSDKITLEFPSGIKAHLSKSTGTEIIERLINS